MSVRLFSRWAVCTSIGLAACASTSLHDPLMPARSSFGQVANREAVIPVQCYTKTDGISNPCWTCHTDKNGRNQMMDWKLQEEYAFSDQGKNNHWSNLFADRSAVVSTISDRESLDYIRTDNYSPLLQSLQVRAGYQGWKPDLDLILGFDAEGFAKDGSWWRAFRYKPFLGTFWPTNGSTDDVFIRLPPIYYQDTQKNFSKEIYKINLAILEAAMSGADTTPDIALSRRVEALDEDIAGVDLNRDGRIAGKVSRIAGLPSHFVGSAQQVPVSRYLYPSGTEFLHTVRYVDPDTPSLLSARLKEVRYSVKRDWTNETSLNLAYTEEKDHKDRGLLPHYIGTSDRGLINDFGWQLQGFIENKRGELRLQTHEEHYYCMGCHGTIGVTVDQTFGFPRKVPGEAGWGHQSIAGIKDVPQVGHADPEILTYFRRVKGGDEFRENEEILQRFFPNGQLDEAGVRRASMGGDQDILWLLKPSRERALALNKAYMALVREQSFDKGRDVLIKPAKNVHRSIENEATGFDIHSGIYRDGRLWLQWPE